ncbi:MAG: glycogen synthase GlgA [Candidatus Omnitrophica bacterium]|nr:glycogen synthase GlgA [Candidatus Omnitrophota bacterium]
MKVLFCSSEVVPFAKTGGLADVAGTLPPELANLGVEIKVVLPYYKSIETKKFKIKKIDKDTAVAVIQNNVEVYFIENKKYFDRASLYQYNGVDYRDNLERFTYYCQQTLKLAKKIKFKPDIIHCNDWQSALIPIYLKTIYKKDVFYKKTKTVFTIHNLGYQGLFPKEDLALTGLSDAVFSIDGLEFYGRINLLKGGLLFSDKITTVSATYAEEIQTPQFGCGLEGVLQKRKSDLSGILNGINCQDWDPKKNKALTKNYGPDDIEGKYNNKTNLQKICKLKVNNRIPLLGIITRLADQKGLDILAEVIDKIVQMPIQFVLLGTGDPKYHKLFESIKDKYKNTAIYLSFDPKLAYKIYAGSDMFLMPSYYEPCGLGQLISLNFGTIPIVRKTGGLADTVVDYDPFSKKGNGFVFDNYQSGALLETIKRALCVYHDAEEWKRLVRGAMKCNFSWEASASEYYTLYKKTIGSKK